MCGPSTVILYNARKIQHGRYTNTKGIHVSGQFFLAKTGQTCNVLQVMKLFQASTLQAFLFHLFKQPTTYKRTVLVIVLHIQIKCGQGMQD